MPRTAIGVPSQPWRSPPRRPAERERVRGGACGNVCVLHPYETGIYKKGNGGGLGTSTIISSALFSTVVQADEWGNSAEAALRAMPQALAQQRGVESTPPAPPPPHAK